MVEGVAAVQRTDGEALDEHADDAHDERRDDERDPEAGLAERVDDGEREVRAEREQLAVREVDDIHHAEDDRQPRRQQHVDHPERETVEELLDEA